MPLLLGQGAFGDVYLLDDRTVVKVGKLGVFEVDALASLGQQGLTPALLGHYKQGEREAVRMAYVPGCTLRAACTQAAIAAAATALAGIHAAGWVHGDTHTANVIFDDASGTARWIDLGLARPSVDYKRRAEDLARFVCSLNEDGLSIELQAGAVDAYIAAAGDRILPFLPRFIRRWYES